VNTVVGGDVCGVVGAVLTGGACGVCGVVAGGVPPPAAGAWVTGGPDAAPLPLPPPPLGGAETGCDERPPLAAPPGAVVLAGAPKVGMTDVVAGVVDDGAARVMIAFFGIFDAGIRWWFAS